MKICVKRMPLSRINMAHGRSAQVEPELLILRKILDGTNLVRQDYNGIGGW